VSSWLEMIIMLSKNYKSL